MSNEFCPRPGEQERGAVCFIIALLTAQDPQNSFWTPLWYCDLLKLWLLIAIPGSSLFVKWQ